MDHHPPTNPGPNFNPPGFAPNPPVMNPNPPAFNPNPPVPPFNPPAVNGPDGSNPIVGGSTSDSASSSGGLSRGKIIALVVGVIVVGLCVLLGGAGLLLYTLKGGSNGQRPRRRPRRDDY
jgi:hypothetical protein